MKPDSTQEPNHTPNRELDLREEIKSEVFTNVQNMLNLEKKPPGDFLSQVTRKAPSSYKNKIYSKAANKTAAEWEQKLSEVQDFIAAIKYFKLDSNKGIEAAIHRIVTIAEEYTSVLYSLTIARPDLVKPYAETRATWPIPTTISPANGATNRRRLKEIGLGSKVQSPRQRDSERGMRVTQEAKALIRIGFNLYQMFCCSDKNTPNISNSKPVIRACRHENPKTVKLEILDLTDMFKLSASISDGKTSRIPSIPKNKHRMFKLTLSLAACDPQAWPAIRKNIAEIGEMCKTLPPISGDSLDEWKPVLKFIWMKKYAGKPEEDPELNEIGKSGRGKYTPTDGSPSPEASAVSNHRTLMWGQITQAIECQVFTPQQKATMRGGKGEAGTPTQPVRTGPNPPQAQ